MKEGQMNSKKENFYRTFWEIHDLLEAQQLLEWDQQVIMPAKGSAQRADSISALAKTVHEKITSPKFDEILSDFEGGEEDDWDRANLKEARRTYNRQKLIPTRLIAEKSKASAIAQSVWETTKPKSDFAAFLPHLKKVLDITREIAVLGDPENPYDFLLDDYELSMTTKELDPLFENLKEEIGKNLEKYSSGAVAAKNILERRVSGAAQEKIGRFFLGEMGFDQDAGRLDVSTHPFTSGTMNDVRLTTRYKEDFLPTSLFGVLHEGGHALYEQGLDEKHYRDPAGQSCSLGIHESQSRFWENIVGRSKAFWEKYLPFVAGESEGVFNGISVGDFYKAINIVRPSFIRVESDEVTYNLHIILRYEIEKGLMKNEIKASDLPEVWNHKFKELFGITPEAHNLGVMQDVHWSVGLIGYFPTYSLGNLYSAQIKEAMENELGSLDNLILEGRLKTVREYLREKIHCFGRLYPPQELIRKVTGNSLSALPFLKYIKEKYDPLFS
jgi:carboxypeptidase Taq